MALAAYQRAATVIDAADKTCHMPWQLVAAIGRVESDHGRADGNTLTDRGIDKPGIFGPALDGTHGTVKIRDTDAGQYDGDSRFDRAVGPMQFIPSTWAIVGVDADNDGQRNPQDIYDAALGSAVYLCSGPDDLSTTAGQRAAVFRYNHSQKYVDLVLAIEQAYLRGDFTSVPNGTTDHGLLARQTRRSAARRTVTTAITTHHHHHHHPTGNDPTGSPDHGPDDGARPTWRPTGGPTHGPTGGPTSSTDAPDPAGHGAGRRSHDQRAAHPRPDDPHPGPGDRAVPGRGPARQPARHARRRSTPASYQRSPATDEGVARSRTSVS